MKPLSDTFFGSSGLQCVFAVDDAGNTAVGYVIKQLGSKIYRVTNGTVTKVCTLAQNSSDVADLSNMPPGMCTFWLSINNEIEHIKYLDSTKCATIESGLRTWRDENFGTIVIPILSPPLPPNAPLFNATAIQPDYGGATFSLANGISEDGSIIAGYVRDSGNKGVYWDIDNNIHMLPSSEGGEESVCTGVSGDGTIFVGSLQTLFTSTPIYWDDEGIHDLPMLPGATYSTANGISSDGSTIVGQCDNTDQDGGHPVYWRNGEITDLGSLGFQNTRAYAASRDGSVIVGAVNVNNFTENAAVWRDGVHSTLEMYPGGGYSSRAQAVSYNGTVIVGWARESNFNQHAVYWDNNGNLHDLGFYAGGSYSYANTVSADGTLIGGSGDDEFGNEIPLYWLNGVVHTVNGISGGQAGYTGQISVVAADMSTAAGDGWDAAFSELVIIWRNGS